MKKCVYTAVVLSFTALLFFLIKWPEKSPAPNIEKAENFRAGQSSPTGWNKKDDAEIAETKPQDKLSTRTYKPKSLNVGSGGTTVLEIDHGLPKQLVDTPEMRRGVDYGLNGAITLRVVDSTGKPVSGATVRGAFYNQWLPKGKRRFEIGTDVDGKGSLENKNTGFVNFSVEKEAYYESVFRYWFLKTGYNCVKDGRWIPWNPTVEVVLKEKRNPVDMPRKERLWLTFPKHQPVGFDLGVGDLVAPFGTGKASNLSFWYDSWQCSNPYCASNLFVITAGDGGEITTMRKDSFSDFKFSYTPPDSGWVSDLTLGMVRTKDKILSNASLGKEEYWVVAVQNKTGGRQFAVISDFEFGGSGQGTNDCGVLLSYYLNPNQNDPNLENKNIH